MGRPRGSTSTTELSELVTELEQHMMTAADLSREMIDRARRLDQSIEHMQRASDRLRKIGMRGVKT